MVAVLFRTLDAFRIFDNVFIMTSGAQNTEVLSLLAYRTRPSAGWRSASGSAVSVLLFLVRAADLFHLRQAVQSGPGQARGETSDETCTEQGAGGWIIVAILMHALRAVPGGCGSWPLSFKLPSELTTGKFLPTHVAGTNYGRSWSARRRICSSARCAIPSASR